MFTRILTDHELRLVAPDVERDATLGVGWLEGEPGRQTLRMMGVPDKAITQPTIEAEQKRVQEFLDKENQLNWMIELDGHVVGAIWVDLEPTGHLDAPGIHIMIGSPDARGQGVGTRSMQLVLDYLHDSYATVYSRYQPINEKVVRMNKTLGFVPDGEPYQDDDGLTWQNIVHNAKK